MITVCLLSKSQRNHVLQVQNAGEGICLPNLNDKKISSVFPFKGSFSLAALYHWPASLLPAPGQKEGPWLTEWRAAKNMKPTPISWGHQKAVNWLDIEQQLFYSNCPLYLHPVPVPGVYNGSMYPKCLYPDQPAATRSKDLFFPSAGLPEESSPIRNFFSPQRRIMKKQRSLAHSAHVRALECRKDGTSTKCRREAISVVISLLQ